MALIHTSAQSAPNQSEIAAEAYFRAYSALCAAADSDPLLRENTAFLEAASNIYALFAAAFVGEAQQ